MAGQADLGLRLIKPRTLRRTLNHLGRASGWRLGLAALLALAAGSPSQAVKVSATHINPLGPHTNSMGLNPKLVIFDPGTPNFIGTTSLAAPPTGFPPNTDTISGFTFPGPAVQMTGDAISSISQPLASVFDLNLKLTNFTISSFNYIPQIGRAHV